MQTSLDCIFLIREVPDIEFSDGNFHVVYRIGKQASFEVAIPPSTFLKALQIATGAAEDFQARCKGVVPLRRRKGAKPAH